MSEQSAEAVAGIPSKSGQLSRVILSKRVGLLVFGSIVLVCVVAYGIHWWTIGRFIESTDDAYVGGDVTVISPHVSGYVSKILVKDNQYVRAGQALIRLETHDYQAALDASDADVEERKASVNRLHAQYQYEKAMISEAKADLAAKRASAEFAEQDARRYRSLAQRQAGSQQNAERSIAAAQVARASVTAAEAGVLAARQQLTVIDTQIGEAQAALMQAKATQHTAQLDLGYTELHSPIDGYVGDRSAHPGTYVMAGTQLLSIVPARGLWVDANFKEDQIRDMKPGQMVDVVTDVMPSRTFRGHVQSLSAATGAVFSVIPAQNATGNFTKIVQRVPVRIALDPNDSALAALRAGLSATVSVDTRADHDSRSDR